MGLFTSDKTYSLEPMLTEEQKQAQRLLSSISQGGNIAGVDLGEQYGGSMGSFTPTATEGLATNRIYELLNAGTPTALNTAENTLTRLADTSFDPQDPSSGYSAYSRQVARATRDADDVLNREAAITGNRFGDRILGAKTDLAERQGDILATKLAELYNIAQNRSLAGAQGLVGLAGTQNQMDLNNIQTGATVGSLQRLLDTAKAQSQYEEWQRARNERLGTALDATSQLYNRNIPYGAKELTSTRSTPFGALLNAGLSGIGTGVGLGVGDLISGKIADIFKKDDQTV